MLRGEPIWHTSSTGPMSMPSSSDAVATSARRSPARQPGLDPVAPFLGEAPVVRGHDVVAEPFAEHVREPFGGAARAHEHERRVMFLDERGDAVEHVGHLLGARDRFDLALRQLDPEVEGADVPAVDDRRQRPVADQQPRHRLDRSLRRRQADAVRPRVAQRFQPLEREREVRAALVARDGVDLVDDHRVDRAQRGAPARARHQEVQRLRCRHDEARRLAHQARPLGTASCRRFGHRRRSTARRARARPRSPRSRGAAVAGSRRCRPRAPSTATRTRRARCRRSAHRPRARGRAG